MSMVLQQVIKLQTDECFRTRAKRRMTEQSLGMTLF